MPSARSHHFRKPSKACEAYQRARADAGVARDQATTAGWELAHRLIRAGVTSARGDTPEQVIAGALNLPAGTLDDQLMEAMEILPSRSPAAQAAAIATAVQRYQRAWASRTAAFAELEYRRFEFLLTAEGRETIGERFPELVPVAERIEADRRVWRDARDTMRGKGFRRDRTDGPISGPLLDPDATSERVCRTSVVAVPTKDGARHITRWASMNRYYAARFLGGLDIHGRQLSAEILYCAVHIEQGHRVAQTTILFADNRELPEQHDVILPEPHTNSEAADAAARARAVATAGCAALAVVSTDTSPLTEWSRVLVAAGWWAASGESTTQPKPTVRAIFHRCWQAWVPSNDDLRSRQVVILDPAGPRPSGYLAGHGSERCAVSLSTMGDGSWHVRAVAMNRPSRGVWSRSIDGNETDADREARRWAVMHACGLSAHAAPAH